jgi:hypothetical protein
MIQYNLTPTQAPELQRPDPPASLLNAVKVIYLGALVAVIHGVIYLVTESSEKAALASKHPNLSASDLNAAAHAVQIAGAVGGLLVALLVVWIARECRSGKNWARVTGTVLFGIGALGVIYDFLSGETTLNLIGTTAGCLIGLTAIVLLWQRSSSAYFAFFKRPQS